jgi:queuosine precursor transporter
VNDKSNKNERGHMNQKAILIGGYLLAIIAANISVALFGPEVSILNAFLLVGLVLSTRDQLHEIWQKHRARNMLLLIAVGSALSYGFSLLLADDLLPPDVVAKIALASVAAFASAELVDALSYEGMRRRSVEWLHRVNLSNVLGAAVDSVVFVLIAFGWDWQIAFGQFTAKIAGGFLWSLVIDHYRNKA